MFTKVVLNTVTNELKRRGVSGVTTVEIGNLPNGKIPASWGERFLNITPDFISTTSDVSGDVRKKYIRLGVTLIQRVRRIPNDRFGGICYLDNESMTDVLDECIYYIESNITLRALKTCLSSCSPKGYLGIAETFLLESAQLEPVELYPDFFHGDNDTDHSFKVAGLKMTYQFRSPLLITSIKDGPGECEIGDSSSVIIEDLSCQ